MLKDLSPNMKAAIFTAIVTLTLAALSVAYTYGYNAGARDLEMVNDFKKLNLPNLISDLNILAKDVHERASIAADNQRLGKELADSNATVQNLTAEASKRQQEAVALHEQIAGLQADLSKIFPTERVFTRVKEHDTTRVFENALTISLPG